MYLNSHLVESITQEELVSLLNQNPSFKGYFQGYIAENKLEKQLRLIPEFSNIYKIPDVHKRKGDFCVTYKGKELTIELKSLATRGIKNDLLSGGIRGSVSLKHTGSREMENGNKTVSLSRSKFDVLAICTLASSTKWEFKYILNIKL